MGEKLITPSMRSLLDRINRAGAYTLAPKEDADALELYKAGLIVIVGVTAWKKTTQPKGGK